MLKTPARFRGALPRRVIPAPRPNFSFDTISMLEELHKMYKSFSEGLEFLQVVFASMAEVKKGDQGLPGAPGRDGQNARDVTIEQVETAVRKFLRQPKDGISPDPQKVAEQVLSSKKFFKMLKERIAQESNGKNAQIPAMEVITALVEEHVGRIRIRPGQVEGLDAKIAEIRNHAATGKWRGGGDDVQAGSNVTITRDPNGNKVINATSGGVGAWSTPPETPDGVITVFTVGAQPTDVVADGILFYLGAGYSYAAGQITFDNPPAQYVRYR